MTGKADRVFVGAVTGFVVLGFAAIAFSSLDGDRFPLPPGPSPKPPATTNVVDPVDTGSQRPASWFAEMRGHCNPVDVAVRLQWTPAPDTPEGAMYTAACLALAGHIDKARTSLLALSDDDQWRGAGVVFEAGHSAADAGDELAAGPLMELVVEFWPNHYMALYHAGAAAFERDEPELAEEYLTRFLDNYQPEDGWRANALTILAEIR
jgi:hypothetical protein